MIPNYIMSILQANNGILQNLVKIMIDFLWTGNIEDRKKIPLTSWDNICQVKGEVRVSIHNLTNKNLNLEDK